ncbi:MAG: hypothetical protein ACI8W0_001884 [Flavobacterium sp.]|jgi:hypothetical protein
MLLKNNNIDGLKIKCTKSKLMICIFKTVATLSKHKPLDYASFAHALLCLFFYCYLMNSIAFSKAC